LQQHDAPWRALATEVREAISQALPPDSPPAQDLAWRWMRLAQDIVGITPAMFEWVGVAFVHARCARLAPYLTAVQLAEVRRRQLDGLPHMHAWPALAAELRAQLQAGTDAQSPVVQDIARRWQQLFRDSYCGDDAALESRVRHALVHEADLRLGVGDELMAYLQQAHISAHPVHSEFAGPKPSALMVAQQRAAHQLLETPRVLDDPLALAMLGEAEQTALRANLARQAEPMALGLRSSVVVRSRLAEDEWAQAMARGVRQYVVLGAGLDTSTLRHPDAPGQMFEVDLPSTQAWKRQRMQEAGIGVPPRLHWVPVDFETVHLAQGLALAGFDATQPAFFSWLGVTMYLEPAAVIDTLRFVAGCAKGSAILFEYALPLEQLPAMVRTVMQQVTRQLAAHGEPWKAFFDTDALTAELAAMGFSAHHGFGPEALNQRYLAQRSDGLRVGSGPARLMLARV
jgi:methyltransferase (TIGR00027 family)